MIELVSADEVAEFADGPEGFIGFERLCRRSLGRALDEQSQGETDTLYRLSYLGSVAAAADEYGVDPGGVLDRDKYVYNDVNGFNTEFDAFDAAVRGLVTRLQIQIARKKRAVELVLSESDQTKIEHYVRALRDRIDREPSLSDAKKKALHRKLDELLANLNSRKIDLARTMIIVGGFFTAVNQGEAAIIKLPETIAAIAKLVSTAKDFQDSLLTPAPALRQISDQTSARDNFPAELDDEIPF